MNDLRVCMYLVHFLHLRFLGLLQSHTRRDTRDALDKSTTSRFFLSREWFNVCYTKYLHRPSEPLNTVVLVRRGTGAV